MEKIPESRSTATLVGRLFSAYPVRAKIFESLSAYEVRKTLVALKKSGIPYGDIDEEEQAMMMNPLRDIFTGEELQKIDTLIDQGINFTLLGGDVARLFRRLVQDKRGHEGKSKKKLSIYFLVEGRVNGMDIGDSGRYRDKIFLDMWKLKAWQLIHPSGTMHTAIRLTEKLNVPEPSVNAMCFIACNCRAASLKRYFSSIGPELLTPPITHCSLPYININESPFDLQYGTYDPIGTKEPIDDDGCTYVYIHKTHGTVTVPATVNERFWPSEDWKKKETLVFLVRI